MILSFLAFNIMLPQLFVSLLLILTYLNTLSLAKENSLHLYMNDLNDLEKHDLPLALIEDLKQAV